MMNKTEKENTVEFLQLNLGNKINAHDLLMVWLTNSSIDWVCCIQEPYMSAKGVPRLPAKYGVFWSLKANEENDKVRAIIIAPRGLNAYQLSQYSNVDEVYICIEKMNVCIGSVYCSQHRAMNVIVTNLLEFKSEKKKVIVCLDTNAHNPDWGEALRVRGNWKQRKRGEELKECINENGFFICNEVPHIPTFVRRDDNWKAGTSHIDVTICSDEICEYVVEWKVKETVFMTDHNPIMFKYVGKRDVVEKKKVKERKGVPWKNPTAKMNKIMCEELEKNVKYMTRVRNEREIDRFIEIHKSEIQRVLHGVFKEKKKGIEKVYWWTEAVEKAHVSLKRARKRMRRYRYENLKVEFNKCRVIFRKEVNKAKSDSWKRFLSSIQSPWEGLIKIVRAAEVGKIQTRTLANLEGKYGKDMEQTFRMLGKQFYPTPAAFTEEQIDIEEKVKNELEMVYELRPKISVHELRFALTLISKGSAPGDDEVTNNVMKILVTQKFENMYLSVFNKCLELSYFPREWKKALITLIPKYGGIYDSVKSFRPISLTSVYAKLFERILLLRLQHYLKMSGKMVENQHAYRKGRSTQTALYEMFEVVQYAVNKRGGGVCVVVFLDISGAFDRTWHAGILHKLLQYDIPKYMIAIIKSFLHERSVCFREGECEYEMDLTQGCPQGGVLSPVLWNILFNEMLGMEIDQGGKRSNRIKIIGYADDAALVCKADSVQETSEIINVHLEKIHVWSVKNRVVFNVNKLAALTITNWQTLVPPAAIYYNGIPVNEVTRYKYLGVTVDNKLNWKAQIDEVIGKLDKITSSLKRLRGMEWGLKVNLFRTLYRAIFYPVMTYGISIWGWKAAQKR